METTIPLLPDTASLDEIDEELAFLSVLKDSMDPGADDYDEKIREHESCRRHYERMKDRLLAQGHSEGYDHARANTAGASLHSNGDDDQPDPNSWWQAAKDPRPWDNVGETVMPSTSHATSSRGIQFGTPSNLMKRSLPGSSHLNADHATKRQTPDPSNAGTPESSSDSFELLFPSRDTASSQQDKFRAQQAAAEAAAKRRREAEAADAKMAAELELQISRSTPSGFASSSSLSRPAFQTTLTHSGGYHRPPPVKQELSATQDSVYPNSRIARPANNQDSMPSDMPSQSIKPEPGSSHTQQVAQRPRQPTVVDLTGSDSEDDDITEVLPNGLNQQQRPGFAPASSQWSGRPLPQVQQPMQNTQRPSPYMQMPGAYPWSSGTNNHLSNGHGAAMNGTPNPRVAYNAPYSQGLLGRATSGIHSTIGTIGSQMQQLGDLLGGSSSRPFTFDDSDDDDEILFRGSRQLPGGYAGNENLYNTRYDQLAAYDPTRSKEEIQALLNNIRPDEDMPAHLRVQTPPDMSVNLHKYQEMGLTWLQKCEDGSNKGGILADDMGLGKTIQMLSLMVTHKSEDPRCKTTLIVAPVALMRQWKQEIHDKLKPGRAQLTVFTHHGTKKAKSFQELRTYDVVLTTYGSLASELKKMEKFHLRKVTDPNARPYPNEQCVFLDPDSNWYRVVLDEAQVCQTIVRLILRSTNS
jgi:hypothetical protein